MRVFLPIFLIVFACSNSSVQKRPTCEIEDEPEEFVPELTADSFDFPVGPPNAIGYYNAQVFGMNAHLGDDWNGKNGGNSDLGDPVYAVANGKVSYAENFNTSWGNVIRIVHYMKDGTRVESLYAHCQKMLVVEGEWIKKGTQIGTIGTADGRYPAHLHFEIRDEINMSVGSGYSSNTKGYLDPTKFINSHRRIAEN